MRVQFAYLCLFIHLLLFYVQQITRVPKVTRAGRPLGFVEQDVSESQLAARLADAETWVQPNQTAAQLESTPLQSGTQS